MSQTSPTWYDVLGVPRDASSAEIKAAWRDATDKFEPGSGAGQFRMFNEAADVLLDPDRRAAYDASLGSPEPDEAAGRVPNVASAPTDEPSTRGPVPTEPESHDVPVAPAVPSRPRTSRRLWVLLGVLAVLTAVAIGVAVWQGLAVREDSRVADTRSEAPAAAERAAAAMLSYDYRQLAQDRERAADHLTEAYGKEYLKVYSTLEKQKDGAPGLAVQTKAVVKASVLGSGVVDADEDTARVVVFVNQTSSKAGAEPQIFQNRVTVTMKRDGQRWLVDDLKSY